MSLASCRRTHQSCVPIGIGFHAAARGASHGRQQQRGGGGATQLESVTTGPRYSPHEKVPPSAPCRVEPPAIRASAAGLCTASERLASARLLLRRPAISRTQLVFNYAGDLWIVGRDGGDARRLTSAVGDETNPALLPGRDARRVQRRVRRQPGRVRRAGGGRRAAPADVASRAETVAGLDPRRQERSCSRRVGEQLLPLRRPALHACPSRAASRPRLPLPIGGEALASRPTAPTWPTSRTAQWQQAWKRYRGGQTTPHLDRRPRGLDASRTIPRDNSERLQSRCGSGDTVYFLSDRNGPVSLLRLRHEDEAGPRGVTATASTSSRRSPAPDAIVSSSSAPSRCSTRRRAGRRRADARVRATSPRCGRTSRQVEPDASSTGPLPHRRARRLRGLRRDLHRARRQGRHPQPDPQPRGRRTRSGLVARRQVDRLLLRRSRRVRAADPRPERLGRGAASSASATPPSFFYSPAWSPDSKKIAYTDKRLKPLVRRCRRRRRAAAHRHRLLRRSALALQPGLVARQQVDRLHASSSRITCTPSSSTRSSRARPSGHRRHERRALSRLRQERQVPLLHRLHRPRPRHRRARHVQQRAAA